MYEDFHFKVNTDVIPLLLRRHLYMETDPSPLDKAILWGLQSFRWAWNFLNYQALLSCISLSLRSDTVKCQQGGPRSSILLAPCKRYPPPIHMMTSSNGNLFRVTGPLCEEFTGPGEFPTQRPVTRSFDVFFDLRLNKRLSKQSWGWWVETPSWSLCRHYNDVFSQQWASNA